MPTPCNVYLDGILSSAICTVNSNYTQIDGAFTNATVKDNYSLKICDIVVPLGSKVSFIEFKNYTFFYQNLPFMDLNFFVESQLGLNAVQWNHRDQTEEQPVLIDFSVDSNNHVALPAGLTLTLRFKNIMNSIDIINVTIKENGIVKETH